MNETDSYTSPVKHDASTCLPTVSCTEDELEQGKACCVNWAFSDAVLPVLWPFNSGIGRNTYVRRFVAARRKHSAYP